MRDHLGQVRAEVERRHQLLARWLATPAEPAVLDALDAAHTGDFAMVTAEGQVVGREALLDTLRHARGTRSGLRILVSDVAIVAELGSGVLARFLQTHVEHGHTSSRRVSVLLCRDDAGLRWRYVHETRMPE